MEVLNLEESSCRLFFLGRFLLFVRDEVIIAGEKMCANAFFGRPLFVFFVGENKWRNLMAWNVMTFVLVLMLYLYTVVGLFAD